MVGTAGGNPETTRDSNVIENDPGMFA